MCKNYMLSLKYTSMLFMAAILQLSRATLTKNCFIQSKEAYGSGAGTMFSDQAQLFDTITNLDISY